MSIVVIFVIIIIITTTKVIAVLFYFFFTIVVAIIVISYYVRKHLPKLLLLPLIYNFYCSSYVFLSLSSQLVMTYCHPPTVDQDLIRDLK